MKTIKIVDENVIKELLNEYKNINAAGNRILNCWTPFKSRCLRLIKEQVGFTANEVKLMLDCHNGMIFNPQFASTQFLSAQVKDSINLDATDKKWEVEKEDILYKIASLCDIESAFLIEWLTTFWQKRPNPDIDQYITVIIRDK